MFSLDVVSFYFTLNGCQDETLQQNRITPFNSYPDAYSLFKPVNSNMKMRFPRVVSFMKPEFKNPATSTSVSYSYDNPYYASVKPYLIYGDTDDYFDGSGFNFVSVYERRNTVYYSTKLSKDSTRSEKAFFEPNHFFISNDEKKAIAFGYFNLYDRDLLPIKIPVKLIVESVDDVGTISMNYSLLNDTKQNIIFKGSYGVHMDINGTHKSTEMKTLGENRGIYFEVPSDKFPTETNLGLAALEYEKEGQTTRAPYYVSFATKSQGGADDVEALMTNKLESSTSNNWNVVPDSWLTIGGILDANYSKNRIDLPYGTVIPDYTKDGKPLANGRPIEKPTGLEVWDKNNHPSWSLIFKNKETKPNDIASYTVNGKVSDVRPIDYSPSEAIFEYKKKDNVLPDLNWAISQPLDAEILNKEFQPNKLKIGFSFDSTVHGIPQLTKEEISVKMIGNKQNETTLDPSVYEFKKNLEGMYEVIIKNDFETGDGENGFLWKNKMNENGEYKTLLIVPNSSIPPITPITQEHGLLYNTDLDSLGFKKDTIHTSTYWGTNIKPYEETLGYKQEKSSLVPFKANLYNSESGNKKSIQQNQTNVSPLYFLKEELLPDFDWEEYTYEFTDEKGLTKPLDTSSVGNGKTTYATVTSPKLNGASKTVQITYDVLAGPVTPSTIKINYVDKYGKVISFPTPEEDYPSSIKGEIGTTSPIKFPEEYKKRVFDRIEKGAPRKPEKPDEEVTPANVVPSKQVGKDYVINGVFEDPNVVYTAYYDTSNAKVVNLTVNYYQKQDGAGTTNKIVNDLTKGTRRGQDTKKDLPIETSSIKNLLETQELYNLAFTGYALDLTNSKNVDIIGSSSQRYTMSSNMPEEDFTVNYYYDSTSDIDLPEQLDFGRHKKNLYGTIYPLIGKKDSKISIIDTYEKADKKLKWDLFVTAETFKNKELVALPANLIFKYQGNQHKIIGENVKLVDSDSSYVKELPLITEDQSEGLFVEIGNIKEVGKYHTTLKLQLSRAP